MNIKQSLLKAGVRNLKEYGYPEVTPENITTDTIYRAFFASMLKDNLGQAGAKVDTEIKALLAECADEA